MIQTETIQPSVYGSGLEDAKLNLLEGLPTLYALCAGIRPPPARALVSLPDPATKRPETTLNF